MNPHILGGGGPAAVTRLEYLALSPRLWAGDADNERKLLMKRINNVDDRILRTGLLGRVCVLVPAAFGRCRFSARPVDRGRPPARAASCSAVVDKSESI